MRAFIQIIIGIFFLFFFYSCSGLHNYRVTNFSLNNIDTLKINSPSTLLIGKQLFPNKVSKDLLSNKILLLFESNNYYYVFYNDKKKEDFLSASYWDELITKYINFSIEDGLLSYTRFIKIDYNDPYLSGFYNSQDSIITSKFYKGDKSRRPLHMYYFSTTDSLLIVDKNISVGKNLEEVLKELKVPYIFNQKKDFELVLMVATTQIDNAWFNTFPKVCSEYSVSIILSIKHNKISRIQYLDLEYIDDVFKQKNVTTKDIHYN